MGIVVIGTSFVDIKGFPEDQSIPTGRNVGRVEYIHGGVARNIVEDIANVELRPTFVSIVDDTPMGDAVLKKLRNHKVNTDYIRATDDGLGTWLAVFDNNGDVAGSISKRPNMLPLVDLLKEKGDEIFAQADSVVLECDLDKVLVKKVLELAKKHGIGTVCHEFSHCLGLMDHYDTQGNNFGTGFWDVMASGSYNNNSCTPAAYTAFERWCMGWLTPKELKTQTDVTGMKPLVESPEAYILYNDANPDEFYMLENRQLMGFDAGLYGHGLMVFHVDYDAQIWATNSVNVAASRQRMTIIPADDAKVAELNSLRADPFPGMLGVNALTDYTTPAAVLYSANANGKKLMGKPIEDIQEDANGLISFKALYPVLKAPTPSCTTAEAGSFTLTWPAVSYAKGYEIQLTEYGGKKSPQESVLIEEHFEGTYKASAGFTDIGPKLSNYVETQGLSGTALFQSPHKLRFGTGTTNGTLKSPTMDTLSTARFTLVLKVKPYTDGAKVEGVVNVVTQISNGMNIPFEFSEEGYLLLYPTENIETRYYFNIKPESRMYLSYLALYDGEFTAEELGLNASTRSKARSHPVTTYYTTEPQYVFEGLNPTSRYEAIVRAVDANRYSPWSEVCNVTFATAIGRVSADNAVADGFYYDLMGRRVGLPVPGNIYVRNGRKVLYK